MKDLKQSIGYFVKYMKPFKNSVLIMVFLLLIAMIAQVVAPYYMGQAVTSLGRFLSHKSHAMADFRQFMLLMCAAFFFQVFAQLVAWVIMSVFNAEATNSMRISLFKKLQKMTIRYFDTHQDGKLLALFNSDIDNIFNALNGAIFDLVSQTILFVGTIVIMFAINVKLALVTMASTPIVVLIAFSVMKKARKYLDEQQEDISVLNGYINEQLNGERIILANGLQKSSIAGFVKKNDKLRTTMFRGQFYSGPVDAEFGNRHLSRNLDRGRKRHVACRRNGFDRHVRSILSNIFHSADQPDFVLLNDSACFDGGQAPVRR